MGCCPGSVCRVCSDDSTCILRQQNAAPNVSHMLYAGMLLGGVPALEGLLVIFLLIAASFVANIFAGVIALLMLRKRKEQK